MAGNMEHEYEARFCDINVDDIRGRLVALGARCVQPRSLLKRIIFENEGLAETRSWLRLRSGSQGSTLTLKRAEELESSLESTRELEVGVSDFDNMQKLLEELNFRPVRFQENYREEWLHDGIVYDIDEWPDLPVFLEIEATDVESVKLGAKRLGLEFPRAVFGSVDELYMACIGRDILAERRLAFRESDVI